MWHPNSWPDIVDYSPKTLPAALFRGLLQKVPGVKIQHPWNDDWEKSVSCFKRNNVTQLHLSTSKGFCVLGLNRHPVHFKDVWRRFFLWEKKRNTEPIITCHHQLKLLILTRAWKGWRLCPTPLLISFTPVHFQWLRGDSSKIVKTYHLSVTVLRHTAKNPTK